VIGGQVALKSDSLLLDRDAGRSARALRTDHPVA
jgi:hypothetical protein